MLASYSSKMGVGNNVIKSMHLYFALQFHRASRLHGRRELYLCIIMCGMKEINFLPAFSLSLTLSLSQLILRCTE